MKTPNKLLFTISTLFLSLSTLVAGAQVINYYHSNFDSGKLDDKFALVSGTTASLEVVSASPLTGTHSLSALGNGAAGNYKISAMPENTNLNNETLGWEWAFTYRSNGSADSNNEWKYWLTRESGDVNAKGFYLTQVGNTLSLKYYVDQYTTHTFDVMSLAANTTYAIRAQRLSSKWQIFVNEASAAPKGAFTFRKQTDWNPGGSNYYSSMLTVKSNVAGRFKFDDLKMYSMQLAISGANDASYGVSNQMYAGQQNSVFYGLEVKTRGLFDLTQIQIGLTGSITSVVESNSVKINRSTDAFFGNADDVFLTALSFDNDKIHHYSYIDSYYSTGAADGSMVSSYFFLTANVKSNPTGSFTVAGVVNFVSGSTWANYGQTGAVTNTAASTPSSSAKAYDWVGNTTAWNTMSNWKMADGNNATVLPGEGDLVRIGVNRTFTQMPNVDSEVKIGNLTIGGNNGNAPVLTINTHGTLTVAGTFKNERASSLLGTGVLAIEGGWLSSGGKIDLLSGNVVIRFNGKKEQRITDMGSDSGKGIVFGNVSFAGGNTKILSTTGKFTIGAGKSITMGANTILQTSGNLILKADASNAASVNAVPSTSAIMGQVTVERFIQGGNKDMWRTYRMLSSPVYDNTTSFINTDVVGNRTYSFAQFIDDMIISGPGGSANGFDQTPLNSAGAWIYNNGFYSIASIDRAVNIGRGAYIFYRGDKTNVTGKVTSPFVDAESIQMTYKGILNQQNVTIPLTHGSTTFSLVGNPYAAVVDWTKVIKTSNVTKIVRVWNPSRKQYSTYNGTDSINGGSKFIPAGQSFFVQTSDNKSPSVTFTEESKVTSASSGASMAKMMSVGRTSTMSVVEEAPARIRVQISRNDFENTDETLIVLKNDAEAAFTDNDVPRMGGEILFLSSRSTDAQELAINYMPHISKVNRLPLTVNANNGGAYTFNFILTDIPLGYEVKLKDNYLSTITDIRNQGSSYQLTINKSDVATFGANRFELLVMPPTTLPVVVSTFEGNKVNEGVVLKWKTSAETNNDYFEIERAGEDQIYTSVGKVSANQLGIYSLLDKAPFNGNNYYRLVQFDKDGKKNTHENIVAVKFELNKEQNSNLLAYPTVVTSTFTLKYNGTLSSSSYLVKISDVTGKNLINQTIDKTTASDGYLGSLSTASAGIYFAELIDISNGKSLGVSKLMKK